MLPDFENPDQDHELLPLEYKEEELFFSWSNNLFNTVPYSSINKSSYNTTY